MTRLFWIIGLSIAVFMFSGFTIVCLVTLVTRRHLNPMGWGMLILGAYAAFFMFGRLRAAIKFGDPTKGLNHDRAV
jgi:hypothetical protein